MLQPVPNFSWYSSNSNRLGLPPRCPFASIHRCPKFYESRSLLGRAGSTPLSAEIETECERKWKQSQFTPQTAEDTPGLFSTEKGVNAFNNFCPEVLYDRFGLFADFLSNYSDEIDRDLAHSRLARDGAQTDDPGWTWSSVRAQHFSECPLYSSLSHGHQPNFPKGTGLQ